METKFTPPLWRIRYACEALPYQIVSENGRAITKWGAFIKPTSAESKANAHLIAAAPTLYEALTRALGVIVEMGNLNGFHTLTDEQLGCAVIEVAQQCSDALALARGEHPESRIGLDPDAGTRQHGEAA